MEDDDEFGDLYTDVLNPLEPRASQRPLPAAPVRHRNPPIDLNLQSPAQPSFPGGLEFDFRLSQKPPDQTLACDSGGGSEKDRDSSLASRVSECEDDKLPEKTSDYAKFREIAGGSDDGEIRFDIEEGDNENEPVIPGLSGGAGEGKSVSGLAADQVGAGGVSTVLKDDEQSIDGGQGGEDERDDLDSDSEDDLQIVLNDNNRHATTGPEKGAGGSEDDDDDDDDEDPLVIVADVDPNHAMEEQEWGEDATQDSERKEGGETGKGSGGAAAGPKIGYSNHVYHPFHSQFKYVRPGAAPTSGATTSGPGVSVGQARPLANMGPMAGRGRGDWRTAGIKNAPMQKSFHSGFAMPWGGNAAGRGFGGGLEFTLPSHKTIFEVDIDAFEEKPWKYPGVDVTDFFNFGLNEESWKDYCKQLEQHRLESTMQSRIRVYESGRTEQGYDPDLPPELAAAAANRDVQADSSNFGKPDTGGNDPTKEPARVRPTLPTGRAIQVETGYGERLPSIDTRAPRIRDSDAIIEIVCQDSLDDEPSTKDGADQVDNDLTGEDPRGDQAPGQNITPTDAECTNGFSDSYDEQRRELSGRVPSRNPSLSSSRNNGPEGDGSRPIFPNEPPRYPPGSRGESPAYSRGKCGTSREERRNPGRPCSRSPIQSERHKRRHKQDEDLNESRDGSPSLRSSSPIQSERHKRRHKQDEDLNESRDGSPSLRSSSPAAVRNGSKSPSGEHKDTRLDVRGSVMEEMTKPTPGAKLLGLQEDGMEDSNAERSSENSKGKSGSSRDYHKLRHGMEDEVIQDRHYGRATSNKKHLDEVDQHHRRKHRDGRLEMETTRADTKGRDDSSSRRDLDPSLPHRPSVKSEDFDRRKEREVSDGAWRRKDDDPYSRRIRDEDSRKRDRGDDLGSRNKGKTRESERGNQEDHLHSRKHLDRGSSKVQDTDARLKEKDDHLNNRYEVADDYHNKRRKDEEYLRRTRADKEDNLRSHRESSSRLKRERDNTLDQKREIQQRGRDSFDEYRSGRHKDDTHIQRDGNERRRDREEWHKSKQTQEEISSKRDRERRAAVRSQHGLEDRTSRLKDEHKGSDKDAAPHVEQRKRRDQTNEESSLHARGHDGSARSNQLGNDEGKSKQEKSGTRNDQNASENQRIQEKKHKESSRKNKEPVSGDVSTSLKSKRESQIGNIKDMALNGTKVQGNSSNETPVLPNSMGKHKDDGSSEHNKPAAETTNARDMKGNEQAHSEKAVSGADGKDAVKKPLGDRHLDTVEKLKKRSERFKLPMPNEKDASTIKKMENEALPSAKSEAPADTEVKPERPARKRRWSSSS